MPLGSILVCSSLVILPGNTKAQARASPSINAESAAITTPPSSIPHVCHQLPHLVSRIHLLGEFQLDQHQHLPSMRRTQWFQQMSISHRSMG